ncbi:unnamed protein product, partial [Urochloa humidicola]
MEYWTGMDLSDQVTQAYMTKFRLKLAAILLLSDLNKLKGTTQVDSDDITGDPDDCVMIENQEMARASPKQTKQSEGVECLMGQEGTHQPIQSHDISSNVYARASEDEELWAFQTMKDVPMSKKDLTLLLCDYIMSIQDEAKL